MMDNEHNNNEIWILRDITESPEVQLEREQKMFRAATLRSVIQAIHEDDELRRELLVALGLNCIRCGQIKRTTECERNICADCRAIELSDYVLGLLLEPGAHDGFYRRVRDKARQHRTPSSPDTENPLTVKTGGFRLNT